MMVFLSCSWFCHVLVYFDVQQMMNKFTPKAGSIAAVAGFDDLFKDCEWVFGQHQISEAFGAHFLDRQTHYELQVLQFEKFRDKSYQSIDNALNCNNNTHLEESLRRELKAWTVVLQQCDDLIAHCEEIGSTETNSGISAQSGGTSAAVYRTHDGSANCFPVAAVLEPSSTSDSAPQPSTRLSDAGQQKPSDYGSTAAPKPNFFRRILNRCFRRRQNDTQIIPPTQNGRSATTMANVSERDSTTQPSPVAVQSWQDRGEEFIELLGTLQKHNLSCSRRVVLNQPESAAAVSETQRIESELDRFRTGGDMLKALIELLKRQPWPQFAFQLLQQSDPFTFQSNLCSDSATCRDNLQDGSAAFQLRISMDRNRTETVGVASPPSNGLGDTDRVQRFFVFNVSPEDSENVPNTELDLETLFERIDNPVPPEWATFYGHFEKKFRIISDATPHSQQRSFIESITDTNEQAQLRKTMYVRMRAQLAFVVASSLFYKLRAEGLHDLKTTRINYHTTLDDEGMEPDLDESRMFPYISLDTIGSTAGQGSSRNALPTFDHADVEERMMKNLGILIYEIGGWTRAPGEGLQGRVTKVDDEKEHLTETGMRITYRDVIRDCLKYSSGDGTVEGREKWMVAKVILPLKKVCESFQDVQLL